MVFQVTLKVPGRIKEHYKKYKWRLQKTSTFCSRDGLEQKFSPVIETVRAIKKIFFKSFDLIFNYFFFHVLVEVRILKGAVLSTRGAKIYTFTKAHRCNHLYTGKPVCPCFARSEPFHLPLLSYTLSVKNLSVKSDNFLPW